MSILHHRRKASDRHLGTIHKRDAGCHVEVWFGRQSEKAGYSLAQTRKSNRLAKITALLTITQCSSL
jgi:hypothetical protein